MHRFQALEEEQEFLARELKELVRDCAPEGICLVARTARLLAENYTPALREAAIPHTVLEKDAAPPDGCVRLANMHRVKGLEFRCMVLAGINEGCIPLKVAGLEDDPTAQAEHDAKERSLLFVAATRARDRLIITTSGGPSRYL